MQHKGFLLKNAIIVSDDRRFKGDLFIQNGLIQKIFEGGHNGTFTQEDVHVMDMEGLMLLPGVIDDQVHFREPGLTHKADIYTESRAAVAGGITSFMEMPNTNPQTVTQELLAKKFNLASEKSLANYSFYMGATNDNLDELKATDPEHVCGVKVFMGSSTGNMLVDNPNTLSAIFRDIKLPIAVHCEDEEVIKTNLSRAKDVYGEHIPIFMHPLIRSHEACERSSRLAVSLAERYGTRLHLLHLSTRDELRLLRNDLPLKEKQITAEVCVHHLWFSMDDYHQKGSFIKWNPAVKFDEDRKALLNGIQEGYLDVIATDHAPHTIEEKQNSYLNSPSGGPMVQHALPLMLTIANRHGISIEKVVRLMCHNPAICFGVKNRGFIREGFAADLVAVNTNKAFKVEKENILYKCKWSPLEGTTLDAGVAYTFVNGHLVFKNGEFDEEARGQALVFGR